MGCTGSRSTTIKVNTNKNMKISDVKRKCYNLYRKNPFFEISKVKLDELNELFINNGRNVQFVLDHLSVNKLYQSQIIPIFETFEKKYTSLADNDNTVESVGSVLYIIILFLTNDKIPNMIKLRKSVIKGIINLSKKDDIYDINCLSKYVRLLIQLFEACLLYLIILFCFLSISENDQAKLLINKEEVNGINPYSINSYIEKQLHDINSELDEKTIDQACIQFGYTTLSKCM